MDFGTSSSRRRTDSLVPMINVVFLLLIFFLMTATIAPVPPFELTEPEAEALAAGQGGDTLFIGPDGALAFAGVQGTAAMTALARREGDSPLDIRADAGLPATRLAGLLGELAALGIDETRLITVDAR
ncbi:MAG: biopolymer transporter ExbD [Rhodobacteraceae bacterium]|nr:biopolymer transporter ExbD [Alphaproteobacteria bacterium]NNF71405.1 biopolymer transporter ExbD [Paracoccaceae bacterium]NNK65226.1 biopolymer transporter ExbD [Paracoccaceae bacterium]